MKQSLTFKLITFCLVSGTLSGSAQAIEYGRVRRVCTVSGTQESIDLPPVDLPIKDVLNMKNVYVEKPPSNLKPEIEWQFGFEPVDEGLRKVLENAKFEADRWNFRLSFQFGPAELISWLRHLGAQEISSTDLNDLSISAKRIERRWIADPGFDSAHSEPVDPFSITIQNGFWENKSVPTTIGYKIQAHFPPHIKRGLSTHLMIECTDTMKF